MFLQFSVFGLLGLILNQVDSGLHFDGLRVSCLMMRSRVMHFRSIVSSSKSSCGWVLILSGQFKITVGQRMFLHLVLVDLVDRFAVALLELSVPYGVARPLSSCIPLSRCKQLVVCCRGRLLATVFGIIAILPLERVSNCTNIPYFDEVAKYFCTEQSSDSSSRVESPPYNYHLPSG